MAYAVMGAGNTQTAPTYQRRQRSGGQRDLSKGTYSKFGEKLDYTYYDSALLAIATTQIRLFQQGLGQGSTPKRQDQTNMSIGGQLPRGQRMTIKNIKIMLSSATALGTAAVQKLYDMLNQTTFEFIITGKDSLISLTLQELMGISTAIAMTPTAAGDNIPFILPRYHGIFPLNIPIILAEQTNFEVKIIHQVAVDTLLAGMVLKVGLNGKLERKS
jgi:hypothetical protein